MSMIFHDRAAISGTHRTSSGYLATEARVARTGIQTYTGAEVGKPGMASVRVYRSADEVFAPAAMASMAHRPITIGHPIADVTASNWKGAAAGWTGESVVRDGEAIRVSMMIADAAAIAAVESGTRELSCGYTCDLAWGAGTTPSGETYDARQVGISINHVAIVPAGRAGSAFRIGDSESFSLRDAAGIPVTLIDRDTGAPTKLNTDLIAAIEAEAAKLGMSVQDYVKHVLRFSWSNAHLSGSTNPNSPAMKEREQ